MNDSIHDTLNKIRIIGKIREGQKLDTSNSLQVYHETYLNWIIRKWNRDNKDEGVRFLRDLYKSLEQSVDGLIADLKNKNDNRKARCIYVMCIIASELKQSIKGLENLSKTYSNYPATVASLEGIVRDYVVVIYNTLIDAIPKDKLTKELKESVTYGTTVIYEGCEDKNSSRNSDKTSDRNLDRNDNRNLDRNLDKTLDRNDNRNLDRNSDKTLDTTTDDDNHDNNHDENYTQSSEYKMSVENW